MTRFFFFLLKQLFFLFSEMITRQLYLQIGTEDQVGSYSFLRPSEHSWFHSAVPEVCFS